MKSVLALYLRALLAALVLAAPQPGMAASQKPSAAKPSSKDTAESHLGKGYDALKQDRYGVAADEFRAALQLDPKLVLRARFPLAVALFEMKKQEEARREFEVVRREAGDHPNISYYLGRLDLEALKFESAIQNLTKAVEKPPFPDAAYYLGYAYFKRDDLANAEKWFKQATELTPHDARVQYQLAQVYRKQGKQEEAKKAMALSNEQRRRDSSESQLRLECARKLDQGPREEARALCEQLYDPDNAEQLTALGTIYGQHGDAEAALKPLRRAAELAPQSPQMQYNLALAYFQLNRFEEARTPLANALARWPDIFQLNALYGAVLSKLGEDLQAYQSLRHAHELNAQDAPAGDLLFMTCLSLARKAQRARQYSDSLQYLEEIAKLRPQEPVPHRIMAEIYELTGRSAQAAKEKRQADRLTRSLAKVSR
ncbi:MAG TPA: tetratricopeptide repeat protein [Terriglobales bacterium]|nr:tetratricopeptide repeat protein [Terriglobales bacterium]